MIKLYNYQQKYFDYVVAHNKRNWIYAWETGLGKTIVALKHYETFYKDKNVVIVAPASKINEQGWDRTIESMCPNMNYETCTYNMLPKKYKNYKDYFVIFDEVHRLKNSTGKWGKAGYELTKISSGFIGLSATPMDNWLDAVNYFKMFHLMKNKTQFIKNYAITDMTYGYLQIVGYKNENKLRNMFNLICKPLDKSEATDLPPIVFEDVHFKPSGIYKNIKKDRIYEDIIYDNQMKLRHGLRLNTNLKDKIDYITDFIDSTNDNVIVFYNYDKELELLKNSTNKKLFICNGYEKNYPKKSEWDSIKNTVTLANYKSGSEAVEFTYANIIIYFSPTDSYTEYYQSYGRCYRNGQTKKVTAYKFVTDNTIEADIYKALENKQDFNINLWERENL